MPLPTNFSSTEHLQDTTIKVVNHRVKSHFKDVGPEDWEPHLDTDRARLRVACTHTEKDTIHETITRLLLFNVEVGAAFNDLAHVYGMPTQDVHISFTFRPEVLFIFQEKAELAKKNKRVPLTFEYRFRLINETTSSMTQAKINQLETKIQQQFPKNYLFKSGRYKFSYYNKEAGYQSLIQAYSVAEAKDLINRLHNISGGEPDWSKLRKSEFVSKNFDQDEYVMVLGKRKKLPKKRSITEAFLTKVELKLHGNLKDIYLYRRFA